MHFFDDNGTKPLKGPTLLSKTSSTPNEGIVEGPVVDGPVVDVSVEIFLMFTRFTMTLSKVLLLLV